MKQIVHMQRQIQTRIEAMSTNGLAVIWRLRPCPQAVPFVIAFGSVYSEQAGMRNSSGTGSFGARGVETNGVLYILSIQSNVKYLRLKPQLMVKHISPWDAVCFSDVTVGTEGWKENQQHCHLAVTLSRQLNTNSCMCSGKSLFERWRPPV